MRLRGLKTLLVALLTLLLVIAGPRTALQAAGRESVAGVSQVQTEMLSPSGSRIIPITQQPFYPELLAASQRWRDAPLSRVIGDSPRETLLNFYAVMARVNNELEFITKQGATQKGFFWSSDTRNHIEQAEELFALAVQALDASVFPESVRIDMAQEAAIQLKEVLDYVLTHSTVPITIPDQAGLKALNDQRSKGSETWTLPLTTITLSAETVDLDS
jgi:MscS family membrane protein